MTELLTFCMAIGINCVVCPGVDTSQIKNPVSNICCCIQIPKIETNRTNEEREG